MSVVDVASVRRITCMCLGSAYGYGVAGACRPLVMGRGPRTRSNRKYQTLPSQCHHEDERIQPLKPTTTTPCADQRRLVAHAVDVDCAATGNTYGGRSLSDVNNGNCGRRRQPLYAVSEVDLTSCNESTAWKRPPSTTDLTSTVDELDHYNVMFGGLLHGGLSLEALPDTNL